MFLIESISLNCSSILHSSMLPTLKRDRKLQNEDEVFTQNAWDETEWTQEMLDEAEKRTREQREESERLGIQLDHIEPHVKDKWNDFYTSHGDKFFKDRKWIFSELQEVTPFLGAEAPACRILEVGCGVGNAVSHIVESNLNTKLQVFCCDLSFKAVEILQIREFHNKNSGMITAFQADICHDFEEKISKVIDPSSLDFIMFIFTLSALKPESMQSAINNLATLLKPGGMIFFRDYAKNDLTQLRFKGKSYLADSYYVRADGTTSYFFDKSLVDQLFKKAGLEQVELKQDNRLLVNRLKEIKMCRCWIQAKYVKPLS